MLPHSHRLTTALFDEVFETGRLFHSDFFTVKVKKVAGNSRSGISVSKKIAKSAVLRNKIRRRAYSTIAELLGAQSKHIFNVHGVLIAKKGAEKARIEEVRGDIRNLFVKMGFLE